MTLDSCSNGAEDPYAFIHTDQENLFPDFGSSGVNLQGEQEQGCNIGAQFDSFSGNFPQACSFREENNDLRGGYGGVVYSSSGIGPAQLDLGASFSGVLQQEPHQVCSFRAQNDGSSTHLQQQEPEQVCSGVVEINSSSSVKEEQEHVEEECSRKR